MHRLELRFPPLVLVAIFAAAIVAASVWMPVVRVPVPAQRALAVLLVLAGLGEALASAFCAYLTRFQIMPEERALLERFGPEFAVYMGQVRRWI